MKYLVKYKRFDSIKGWLIIEKEMETQEAKNCIDFCDFLPHKYQFVSMTIAVKENDND